MELIKLRFIAIEVFQVIKDMNPQYIQNLFTKSKGR